MRWMGRRRVRQFHQHSQHHPCRQHVSFSLNFINYTIVHSSLDFNINHTIAHQSFVFIEATGCRTESLCILLVFHKKKIADFWSKCSNNM
ncbi:hypothetical protein EUGRSUZ_K01994 [Eucalyptus grandis]|uniref:Uncharacterized protein n=2 Tax=Eucalyptus grandis TaxID=71139 RepID=A0ACC3IVR2_EUCGR|nr:hypothetical protein EUGRSUZ_K01994 [Eucalyptus grandis]